MIPTFNISEIIKTEKNSLREIKLKNLQKRITVKMSYDNFISLFSLQANKIIAKRNIDRKFEVTEYNKKMIIEFYYYLTNNPKFSGKLEKGIALIGKNGVGKTLLLESFCNLATLCSQKNITVLHSKALFENIKQKGIEFYAKRAMLIDDIAKEINEGNYFGTKIKPIADLFSLRYDNGALTFMTSNYKNTLKEFYGNTIYDRMIEMFNFFVIDGNSLRK